MTMRISRDIQICGLPAFVARGLMGALHTIEDAHSIGEMHYLLKQSVGMNKKEADQVIDKLKDGGYIEEGKRGCYSRTRLGSSLAAATAAKPIKRATADSLLKMLIANAQHVNDSDEFIDRVESLQVFGSYVRGAELLGDLDVYIDLQPKDPGRPFPQAILEHAYKSGRQFSSYTSKLSWHSTQVFLFLRQRKRSISILSDLRNIPFELQLVEVWPHDKRVEEGVPAEAK